MASYSIYKVLCHPLSNFPGPRLWGWSRLPFIFSLTTGTLQTRIKDFHEKYGPVVRVAPDELSFIDPAAWRDLYTTGNGHKGFPKTKVMSAEPDFVAITDANDTDHTRIRKLLQNAFSVQAVRDREHILQKYIGLLMRRLREQAESSDGSTTTVNVVQWYTFTTFDIAGDLVFSEPFDCLHNEIYHPWIRMIFSHLKASAFFMALRYYSPLDQWFLWSLPKSLLKEKEKFIGMSKDKVARRKKRDLPLSRTSDFMSLALNTAGEESMSIEEMEGTFGTLLIAGSETTATLLSGVTNYLCKLPEVRKRLEEEVRKSCPAENDITLTSTGGLPYLNAVLQEGLRMTPPVPSGSPRIVPPDGARVAGYWIPGGVSDQHSCFDVNEWTNIACRTDSSSSNTLGSLSVGRQLCAPRSISSRTLAQEQHLS